VARRRRLWIAALIIALSGPPLVAIGSIQRDGGMLRR
jgi:hypothetical protein